MGEFVGFELFLGFDLFCFVFVVEDYYVVEGVGCCYYVEVWMERVSDIYLKRGGGWGLSIGEVY